MRVINVLLVVTSVFAAVSAAPVGSDDALVARGTLEEAREVVGRGAPNQGWRREEGKRGAPNQGWRRAEDKREAPNQEWKRSEEKRGAPNQGWKERRGAPNQGWRRD